MTYTEKAAVCMFRDPHKTLNEKRAPCRINECQTGWYVKKLLGFESLTFNNCTLCPHCIYVFCIYLRTNSDLCHLQHKIIGFYKRDEKCLLRGTDWVFK